MDTKAARRKTFDVEYVVVTEDNIEEVASWCGGAIGGTDADRFIRIIDKNAMNQRQTKAFIGDYMSRRNTSFKCYGKKSFLRDFDLLDVTIASEHSELSEREVARSAKTGEFVSKEEAEKNPDTTVVETVQVDPVIPVQSEIPTEDLRMKDESPLAIEEDRAAAAREKP